MTTEADGKLMTEHPGWQHATLPDGRQVEYVHAIPVDHIRGNLVCDVTVLIDGELSEPIRVVMPLGDGE